MAMMPPKATSVAVLVALVGPSCATAPRQPAPVVVASSPPPVATAAGPAPARARQGYTAADVLFMQQMMQHHAQALTMSALVPSRSQRGDVRSLAERIAISQRDEIAMMRRWLERRGEEVPTLAMDHQSHGAGDHTAHMASMPGMLTTAQLAQLGAATGPAFDRLFLTMMIQHHEGALVMVAALTASPGAGQETELFRLTSDIDAGQRAEIRRMRAMLDLSAPAKAP
jgi:uncharacterized protein (DUF305 family)